MGLLRRQHFENQLGQTVRSTPNAAYSFARLSLAYQGPICKVRRASDNTTLDCWSISDISAFCAGTNGFIATWYDQSGNGRHVTQAVNADQPKVFDSATGLIRVGSTVCAAGDGAATFLKIAASSLGFLNAPAMTFAMLTRFDGTLSSQAGSQQVGGANDADPNCWQCQPRADLTQWVPRWSGLVERFTPNPAVTVWQYIVTKIALNANGNTLIARTNKNNLVLATPASGTPAIEASNGTTIFCEMNTVGTNVNFYLGRHALIVYYPTNLTNASRDALESQLEQMRVQ